MPEIKVQCECGQRYKFDVEPLNGQMPYTVQCPLCGFDGTARANEVLRHVLANPPPVAVPAMAAPVVAVAAAAAPAGVINIMDIAKVEMPSAPAAAPSVSVSPAPMRVALATAAPAAAPPAPVPIAPPMTPPATKPRLRLNKPAHEEAPAEAAAATATEAAPEAPPIAPAPRPFRPGARPAAPVKQQSGRKPSFAMGLLGAFLGAALGSALFYLVFKMAGITPEGLGIRGLLAIPVGFLAGLGARVLGKEGSNELGVITGTLTVVGILGTQYLVAWSWWHNEVTGEITSSSSYEEHVTKAKKVMAVLPNETDNEIRIYLAKEFADEGESGTPSAIPADQVKAFRELELPEFRDLASGKLTKEQYEQKHHEEIAAMKKFEEVGEKTFKWIFLILIANKLTIFSTCAATALAYKMSTDA